MITVRQVCKSVPSGEGELHILKNIDLEVADAESLAIIGESGAGKSTLLSLLAGLDVASVCDWYLGVYVDAYEWVELPNTAGMALYADEGAMASKPYAASGKYIQKQGNHCKHCRYNPAKTTGEDACPYNSLYWHFIDRNADRLSGNPRMGLIMGNWRKRDEADKKAIVAWAETLLSRL